MKFVLYAGFHAGLRKDEVINARPEWFDVAGQRLDVRIRPPGTLGPRDPGWKPKGRKERSVPLTEEFRKFLERGAVDLTPTNLTFILHPEVKAGRSRYRYDFRRPFADLLKLHGVANLTFHDCRRTFASLRVSNGTSPYLVAKWLGDTLQTTELHYGHLTPDTREQIKI